MTWGIVYEVLEWTIRIGALIVIPFKRKATATAWLLFLFLLPIPGLLLFLAIGQPRFPRWRTERFEKLRPFYDSVSRELRPPPPSGLDRRRHRRACKTPRCVSAGRGERHRTHRRLRRADPPADRRHRFRRAYGPAADLHLRRRWRRAIRHLRPWPGGQARRSCEVLLDPVGSRPWIGGTIESLRREGVSTRQALPFHWLRGRTRRDMRNHRKLFVIDGIIGYAGSQISSPRISALASSIMSLWHG